MRRRLAFLGRRAEADPGLAGDQPRLGAVGFGRRQRLRNRLGIVPVDGKGGPARGLEAGDLVFAGREAGRAVNRDAVIVEQHDQLAEPEVARERDRLLADALHQAAVAGDHPGVMIDDRVAQAGIQKAFGERHANGIGEPLAERSRRRLDTGRVAVFRMACGLGAELAEVLDLIERHAGSAGQMQQRVKQHRAMSGREHEPVAVRPGRICRIEFQRLSE